MIGKRRENAPEKDRRLAKSLPTARENLYAAVKAAEERARNPKVTSVFTIAYRFCCAVLCYFLSFGKMVMSYTAKSMPDG